MDILYKKKLEKYLRIRNIFLTNYQKNQCIEFLYLLFKWNKRCNLTAVKNISDAILLHLIDSLSIISHIKNVKNILDIGSGCGLPSIPLAIVKPNYFFELTDKNKKKYHFLKQIKIELQLSNIQIYYGNIQNYNTQNNMNIDVITSRACFNILNLTKYCYHIFHKNIKILIMQKKIKFNDIKKIKNNGYKVNIYNMPSIFGIERNLIELKIKKLNSYKMRRT